MKSNFQHCTLQYIRSIKISEELNLFRLVSISKVLAAVWLGGGSFPAYWFKLITQKHLDCGGNSG